MQGFAHANKSDYRITVWDGGVDLCNVLLGNIRSQQLVTVRVKIED